MNINKFAYYNQVISFQHALEMSRRTVDNIKTHLLNMANYKYGKKSQNYNNIHFKYSTKNFTRIIKLRTLPRSDFL